MAYYHTLRYSDTNESAIVHWSQKYLLPTRVSRVNDSNAETARWWFKRFVNNIKMRNLVTSCGTRTPGYYSTFWGVRAAIAAMKSKEVTKSIPCARTHMRTRTRAHTKRRYRRRVVFHDHRWCLRLNINLSVILKFDRLNGQLIIQPVNVRKSAEVVQPSTEFVENWVPCNRRLCR